MPSMRKRAQRTALIASLCAWPLLTLPLPTHASPALPGTQASGPMAAEHSAERSTRRP